MLAGIETPAEKIRILFTTINHTLMMGVNPKISKAFENRFNGKATGSELDSFLKFLSSIETIMKS